MAAAAHGESNVVADLVEWLRTRGDCRLEPGLTDAELDRVERVFELRMPPLWRALLGVTCPISLPASGARWPDWRGGDDVGTRELVEGPVRGLLFDVRHNDFWWHAWGVAPAALADRLDLARRKLAEVPRLTPLVGHWYVGPMDDSPVFSIVQADLYVPAISLADLPAGRGQEQVPDESWPIGSVPFWSELHAYAQLGHHEESAFARLARGGA